ncbi:CAF17-like 4Fe-4S cluster assembly/insertion protein YgfZ [Microbacterium gorillae]|uniref:CAF17-like 4Fe-4S cluster assembly/insertion protein YgfZ n=1 Tax=Microbacterium gorillae TaxID=1231063 RepID=UPI00058E8576|nr:glycine cleavage T C-terminal barrel domain-containing protein [Microbacterium gorillae]
MSAFAALADAVTNDVGVQHYGSPLPEQRALAHGTAVVDLADRAVVALTGPDRLTWLDSITSQAVARLAPDTSGELLVLDPTGHVEHAAGIVDDGETAWLLVDVDDAEPLATWLLRMRFRAQVEITVREDLHVVGFVPGGSAAELVRPSVAPAWQDPWTHVSVGGWQYAHTATHPGTERPWTEAVLTADEHAALAGALGRGVTAAGLLASEALRIAAWRPRWSAERDERLIPHEVDWIRSAVHLDKGCYRGQETVAKVHNLGHPPRRMVMLHLDGSDSVLPEPGTPVREGEKEVGTITSAAMHHELGPIALAIVSRRVAADAVLTISSDGTEISAAQEIVVPADAGATAEIPRITRLSRRPLKQD